MVYTGDELSVVSVCHAAPFRLRWSFTTWLARSGSAVAWTVILPNTSAPSAGVDGLFGAGTTTLRFTLIRW